MFFLKYYTRLSIPQKAAVWYVICNIFQKGIAFLVVPFYIRLLTAAEYGQYTIFQSWCNILIIFATLNLYCGVYTKAIIDYADDRDRYTSSMQGLSSTMTSVLFVVYLLMQQWWNRYLEMDVVTTYLMFLYFLTFPAFSFWTVRQRVENKYKNIVLITLLHSVTTVVVSIILLLYTNLRANAVIWGFLISQIVFGTIFYLYNFLRCKCFYKREYWGYAIKFNIPLIPHYLSLIVLGQVDRILIGYFCGKDKAGIYGLAYQVSMVVNVIVSGINGALVPWIYERFKIRDFKSVKAMSNRLCILVGAMIILAILVTPEIIDVIGTEDYYPAIWIVPAVCLSVYFQFCYGLFCCVEFYYNATKYVMIATTVSATVCLLLNFLLLPRFGYLSAGYASLVCYAIFMLMHYWFMRCVCNRKLDSISIFDIQFIGISCIFQLCIMLFCLVLYTIPVLRYIAIIVLTITIGKNRKQIKSIILKKEIYA